MEYYTEANNPWLIKGETKVVTHRGFIDVSEIKESDLVIDSNGVYNSIHNYIDNIKINN